MNPRLRNILTAVIVLLCSFLNVKTYGQAPIITYGSPKTYALSTAIIPLSPTNTGGAVPAVAYGLVSTFAGNGVRGLLDGTGTAASFKLPVGLTTDASGFVYVADQGNSDIRKISPAGVVTTWAGQGQANYNDGIGTAAGFANPSDITIDAAGNFYVADWLAHTIRKITPGVVVTTFAGSGIQGSTNGTGTAASFNYPNSVVTDPAGNVYVADLANNLIRKITPAGVVSTFAGSGVAGSTNGTGTLASFYHPNSIVIDALGNLYVADQFYGLIRKITPAGVVSTFAGGGTGNATNGTGTAASFFAPTGLAIDAGGNIFVADIGSTLIRKITPAGVVTTLAGSGATGSADGIGINASFNTPSGITADAFGNLYVSDTENNLIRKINITGYTISPALPAGLSFDPATGIISGTPTVTTSATNYTVTAYNATGSSTTTVNITVTIPPVTISSFSPTKAGSGETVTLIGAGFTGATAVSFGGKPAQSFIVVSDAVITAVVAAGSSGTIKVTGASSNNSLAGFTFLTAPVITYTNPQPYILNTAISTLSPTNSGGAVPAATYGQVSTFAGSGSYGSVNGTGSAASFSDPYGIVTDPQGNVYTADYSDNLIRKITPAGVVSTFAGNGTYASVNGTGTAASFKGPTGLAIDLQGNIYVAEHDANLIRKITPAGVVTTLAGSGTSGSANGTGTAASFYVPKSLTTDAAGNVYVSDQNNNLIRKITPAGVVSTFAGSGLAGFTNGTGTAASFNTPEGITSDAQGNLYVADDLNSMIRKITPAGVVSTYAGSGGYGSANGIANAATFANPSGVSTDAAGNVYVADAYYSLIRKISPAGVVTTLAGTGTNGFINAIGTSASFNLPVSLAADQLGNLYITDKANQLIRKIAVVGYTISPALPAGLTFDATTGKISGTPTIAAASAVYTITAYNTAGSSTATINLTVNAPLYAPSISYSGPNTYKVNSTISPLSPTNTGGAVPATVYSQVSTFAGTGTTGNLNGSGTAASFNSQIGVATDGLGNIYVADGGNNLIRKITAAGIVSTFAGSGTSGSVNGTGTGASFNNPYGVATDASGNVYVSDRGNNLIRKITPAGVVTTLAGSGAAGSANGTGAAASFKSPNQICTDAVGNIYVADQLNNLIRKITPAGVVTTFAGSGSTGSVNGTGTAASFNKPSGVAIDGAGNIYVADAANNLIRKITTAGLVTTFAGSGTAGSADGTGAAASFNDPGGLTSDAAGNIYVTDIGNNLVRKITPNAVVTTLAGSGAAGSADGIAKTASFNGPYGITADGNGNIYVSDNNTNLIRKILVTGYAISPALPAGLSFDATTGIISGTATAVSPATIYTISAFNKTGSSQATVNLTVSPPAPPIISYSGPQTYTVNASITPLSPANTGGAVTPGIYGQVTTFAGNGAQSSIDGTGTAASFHFPTGVASDVSGNIFVADLGGNVVRKITPAGVVTTFAGSGAQGFTNGTGTAASFYGPFGLTVDATGNVYVPDDGNNVIRKITPAGVVSTYAGTGALGSANGTTLTATFNSPDNVAIDASGNLYVADGDNNIVRKITPGGIVSTFAGSGSIGATNGTGIAASFNEPDGIAVDASGNVYVADYLNNLIRKITPAGVVSTFAGSGLAGSTDGTGTAASFNNPFSIAVDGSGNVYVADQMNNKIRKITPAGVVSTLAGSGFAAHVDGIGSAASFYSPSGVAVDPSGNVYVADEDNNLIRKINTATAYTISPALPAGLSFDASTGIISGAATVASPATVYTITAFNQDGSGSTKLTLTVTGPMVFNAIAAVNYGTADFSPGANSAQAITYSSSNIAVATIVSGKIHVIGAGTTTITAVSGGLTLTQPLTVNPASLTITADNQNKTYGSANPVLTATYTGFVNADTKSSLTTAPTITTTALATSAAGTYPITVSGAVDNNYVITYAAATLTIAQANLTITANHQTKIYGSPNPALTLTFTGFVNNDSQNNLTTQPVASTTATASSQIGDYPITISGGSSPNYIITYLFDNLTVTPAQLTITADNKTKYYSDDNPALTVSYSGFVNGENQSALASQPSIGTSAITLSPVGSYPITASGASALNYTLNYVAGTLTVNPAPAPTIAALSNNTAITGNSITITGTYFLGTTAVSFGGTNASSFIVNSATSITAVVADGTSGDVVVTTSTGSGKLSGFNFVPVPTITASGPTTILSDGPGVVLTASPGTGFSYQWLLNGVNISGATKASYTATKSGNYTVNISLNSLSEVSDATPVTVIFDLPASNFELTITGVTCDGSTNGFINIKAVQNLNYTATITGNGINKSYAFTDTTTIFNLAAGNYNVCITVAGQDGYENCYNLVVSQPQPLSVYATVDNAAGNVILSLSGGKNYYIQLNGKQYTTTNDTFVLPLQHGTNKVMVTTDRECQGTFEKLINPSMLMTPYPVPFQNVLNINLGQTNYENVQVNIFNTETGKLVYANKYSNQTGVLQLSLDALEKGVFGLHLILNNSETIYKIIK